jgi:hypothetical protein
MRSAFSANRVLGQSSRTPSIRALLACLISIGSISADDSALAQPPARTSEAESPTTDDAEAGDSRELRAHGLAFWLGRIRSDNIGKTEIPVSGSYTSLGLVGNLTRSTARLEADFNADMEYRNYLEDEYDIETAGTLDARALVDIIEDRFAWNFEESFDQGLLDPLVAAGPGNSEAINVFTHGPRLDIPFGRTSFAMSAYRSKNRYDESGQIDNDNDRYELELSRQTSPSATFGLVATTEQTEYSDDLASEYQIDRLFVRINKEFRNASLRADIGSNQIGSGAESRRDPLLDFSLTRRLRAHSEVSISAGREITDTGSQIRSSLDGSASSSDLIVTAAPFERKGFGVSYGLRQLRTDFFLRLGVGEEDYAAGPSLDNEFASSALTLSYGISERIDIGFQYQLYERDFRNAGGSSVTERDSTAGARLHCAVGRRFGLAFGAARYERTGTQSVDETYWEIRLGYSPSGSTSTTLGSLGR